MPLFERELTSVLNPAYCASLLHGVIRGHSECVDPEVGIPVPHLFVALPLLLNPRALDTFAHTRSGLRNVAEKLDSGAETGADLLRTLLTEAKGHRDLALRSLQILLLAKVARLNTKKATLHLEADGRGAPPLQPEGYAEAVKLGRWFASLSVFEITSITKVVY